MRPLFSSAIALGVALSLAACGGAQEVAAPTRTDTSAGTSTDTSTDTSTGTQPPSGGSGIVEAPQQALGPTGDGAPEAITPATTTPSDAAPPVSPVPGTTTPAMPPPALSGLPRGHGLVEMQNLNAEITDLQHLRELLQRIRSEVEVPANLRMPIACTSSLREDVAVVIRQGHTHAHGVRNYRESLGELCGSFESWEFPDENLENSIGRFRTQLGRIENWMKDIRTCLNPGPYDRRCENSYGPQGGTDAADAIAALAVVDEARAVLERAPGGRFPCHHPLWARVEARQWTLRVARAQMPRVPAEVNRICERIGVDTETLATRQRDIQDRVDVDTATAREAEERLRLRVRSLRRRYGIDD